MNRLYKIISGGQTGVDQSALKAALNHGLKTGGWCPPGNVCEDGIIPAVYSLHETPAERSIDAPHYPRSLRTEWNVRDADATLIFHPLDIKIKDLGTEWTKQCAINYMKPYMECDPKDQHDVPKILSWLDKNKIQILNVAGPSEKTVPGIGNKVYRLLCDLLEALKAT